jgi:hypothetical protein
MSEVRSRSESGFALSVPDELLEFVQAGDRDLDASGELKARRRLWRGYAVGAAAVISRMKSRGSGASVALQ